MLLHSIRSLTARWAVALVVASGLGCSSEPSPSGGNPAAGGGGGAGGSGAGGTVSARVQFFVDERPHDPANAEVHTNEARWGDPVRVVVDGLAPAQEVTLEFATGASAMFVADAEGSIDLGRDAPQVGPWEGADVDGPFWSAPAGSKPLFEVDVVARDAATNAELAQATFTRRPLNMGVEATPINEGTIQGLLARPPSEGIKRPAILVFGGSEGGTGSGEIMAYYFAQLGYVALGVGFFGAPNLPPDLAQVPLEILEKDLDLLASQPDVDPARIAVMGGSRGGELALLLGATFPEHVKVVVAQVPSGFVWGSLDSKSAAWTLGGEPLPWVPVSAAVPDVEIIDGEPYYTLAPAFAGDVAAATPAELDAATIRVEETRGPILFLGAEDDALWPSCELSLVSWERLGAAGRGAPFGDRFICLAAAGHAGVSLVGSSTQSSLAYYQSAYDIWLKMGGTPAANARAQRAANTAIRGFLEDNL